MKAAERIADIVNDSVEMLWDAAIEVRDDASLTEEERGNIIGNMILSSMALILTAFVPEEDWGVVLEQLLKEAKDLNDRADLIELAGGLQ